MKKNLLVFILLYYWLQAICQPYPHDVYSRRALETYLVETGEFKPVPQAKDSFWSRTIPQAMRSDYIRLAHSYKGCSWENIPDSVFGEYRTIGNRANYERLSFGIRRQMSCLVMGEILEHNGLLILDVLNGLDYFIHETWWGVSAHYPTNKPEANNQVVDLFNSETANLLAWTVYMLHDELENEKPGICEIIKGEIRRRMLAPARNGKYEWKKNTSNHNTWICANWLSCIMLCEDDRKQQIEDIMQVVACLDWFYKGYPDDGGCDEGVHYWDRAAASLFECVRMLDLATGGYLSFADNSKFKAMASFVCKSYIANNAYVNFADTPSNTIVHVNILFPFGRYIGDKVMTEYAVLLAEEADYQQNPTKLFYRSGNYPSLSRELFFLNEFESFKEGSPQAPLTRDTWMPDLQVMTARERENSTSGLFIAAKGGHNAEKHNHNDVGSFIVYADGEPLFIDIGFATYHSQSFGKNRYNYMNCRSAYHNLPLINGIEQRMGKEHRANNVEYHQNEKMVTFSLNLESAYPKDAFVDKWKRTIRFNRGMNIEITENYKLGKYLRPTEIIYVCRNKPMLKKNERIEIITSVGTRYLEYNPSELNPIIEAVPLDDANIVSSWQTKTLYRIKLRVRGNRLNGRIRYVIK